MKYYFSLIICISLFACKKEDLQVTPKPSPYKKCILQYVVTTGTYPDTSDFFYNDWGAPEKIVSRRRNYYSSVDYMFDYDSSHRIISLRIGRFAGDTFTDRSIKYAYQADRVIRDSTAIPGWAGGGYIIGTYQYDADGKITQYTTTDPYNHVFNYSYLYEPGDPAFENRNVFSGNPILMFVNKDYSRNGVGETYNEFGYPLIFPKRINGTGSSGYQFVASGFNTASYTCPE